ncbi:MAG: aldehyde dehydrogenase family protein [Limisphaerales bacterium]
MTTTLPIHWLETEQDQTGSPAHVLSFTQVGDVVDQALAAARVASSGLRTMTVAERLRYIRLFREHLARSAAQLASQLCLEVQRSPEEFLTSEIIPLLDACRFLEKSAARLLKPRVHSAWSMPLWLAGARHEVIREPLGVVLIIGPSNYPLFLPGVQILQALTAGNAVLFKPAPAGTESAQTLLRLFASAGLPPDLLQLLPSRPDSAIHAVGKKVDKIFLTGSVETGLKVLIHAATAITPAVVELSGCDAVFILPDADLELAARSIAFGLTLNSGRTCIAPRRAFVWPEIADLFATKLQTALAARPKIFLETLSNSELAENIEEETRRGAQLINGSISSELMEGPLVLANVLQESSFALAENWGPYLSIIPVSSEANALSAAHRSPFRLGASIFTRCQATAHRLAAGLQVGSVCVNDLIVPTADGRLPFGGRKQSGFGSTRGPEGLLEMTAVKVVSTRRAGTHLHLRPATPNQFEQLSAYATMAYGGATDRWRALNRLATKALNRFITRRNPSREN